MTWTKLSDDFTDDCWTLSDAAYRLHSDGLVWSNRKLLDCVIPKEDLSRFAKHPDAVQELLDTGYWADAGRSYLIRHHAQYQRLREAVIKQQEANAKNGAKGGQAKAKPREQVADLAGDPPSDPPSKPLEDSEPLSEPLSERDGTGRSLDYGSSQTKDFEEENETVDGWASGIAGGELLAADEDSWRAPGSAPAAAGALPADAVPEDLEAEAGWEVCSVPGCSGSVTDYLRREFGPFCFGHAEASGPAPDYGVCNVDGCRAPLDRWMKEHGGLCFEHRQQKASTA